MAVQVDDARLRHGKTVECACVAGRIGSCGMDVYPVADRQIFRERRVMQERVLAVAGGPGQVVQGTGGTVLGIGERKAKAILRFQGFHHPLKAPTSSRFPTLDSTVALLIVWAGIGLRLVGL